MQLRKLGIWLLSLLLVGVFVSAGSFAENTDQAVWSGQVFKNGENTVFNLPEFNNALYDLEKKKIVTVQEFYQADFKDYRVYLEKGNLTFENKNTSEKNVVEEFVTYDRFFVTDKYVYSVSVDYQYIAVFDESGERIADMKMSGPCNYVAKGGKLYAYLVNTNSTVSIGVIDPVKKDFKFLMTTDGYGLSTDKGGLFIWNYEDKAKGLFSNGQQFSFSIPVYSTYTMDGESIYYVKNDTDVYEINSKQKTGKLLLKCKEKIESINYYQGKLGLVTDGWKYSEFDIKEGVVKKILNNSVYSMAEFNDKSALVVSHDKTALIEREPSGKTRTIVEDVMTSVVKDGIAYYIDLKENLHAVNIATGKSLWTIGRKQLASGKITDESGLREEYGLALVGDKLYGFQEYGTFIVNVNGKLINTGDKVFLQYRSADGYATYFCNEGYGIWNLKTGKVTNIDLRKPFEMKRNGYTVKIKSKNAFKCTYQIDIYKGNKKLLSGVAQDGDDMLWMGEDALLFMEYTGKNYDTITKAFSFKTGKVIKQKDLNTHKVESIVSDQIAVIGHQDNRPEVLTGYEPKTGNLKVIHKDLSADYYQFICANGLLIERRDFINPENGYYDIFNRYAFYESSDQQPIEFNLLTSAYDGVQYINGIIYVLDNGGVVYTIDAKTMEEVYYCQ